MSWGPFAPEGLAAFAAAALAIAKNGPAHTPAADPITYDRKRANTGHYAHGKPRKWRKKRPIGAKGLR